MADPTDSRLVPRPDLSLRSTIVEVRAFFPELAHAPRPGPRAKARIFCTRCHRPHHLHWGEMRHALTRYDARSLQAIIDVYAAKYCFR